MSKIGVGIGEEFPADDSKPAEAPPDRGDRWNTARERDAEHTARREAYRKWREQRRLWRRQWSSEWRARSRAFQRELHKNIHEHYGDYFHDEQRRFGHRTESYAILWAVLGLIAAIALVSFVFANLFIIVGVVALLALIAAYYRGHDPLALEPQDRSPTSRQAAR